MPTTKPGRLSDVARHLVLPSGLATTEWPSVKSRCDAMGVRFDQWQADLVRGALAKRADGKYAATVGGVVWSLPRQVGKTFTVGAMLFALCAEIPGLLILWTAHHTRTSAETFRSMQGMARKPRVAPYIERVLKGAGTEAVVFRNGSRILFGARDQGFGLGFAAVDAIVFDEAQRLADRTRQDMVPAANRAHNPAGALLFYIGTPPRPTDQGEAFASLRLDALAGRADDTFFVELAADPDADPDDRGQWAVANPSFPVHTPVESMLRMRKHLGDDDAWRREALGIWDAEVAGSAIPAAAWKAQSISDGVESDGFFALDVSPMLTHAAICVAGRRADDSLFGEIVQREGQDGLDYRPGTDWVIPALQDLKTRVPDLTVTILKGSQAESLAAEIEDLGIDVERMPMPDFVAACGTVHQGITGGELWHSGQPELAASVAATRWRDVGEGGQAWGRRKSSADITPTIAYTLAVASAIADAPLDVGDVSIEFV